MGAKISVTGPGRGLYLIIWRNTLQESLLKTAGGEIVLRFNGGKTLAALPFTGYLALRSSFHISHIGPVNVDVKRLARISELLSRARPP